MIRTIPETGSTNADLLQALRNGEGVREGDWLVAYRQSAGRGRQGRGWHDGQGNFMGSTLCHLRAGDPPPATLALVAGIALLEAVQAQCPTLANLQLKWPNDLLVGGAKLAGILLEREGAGVVVGIGVNLAAAPDLPDRRTVKLADFGPAPDRDTFAATLAESWTRDLGRWRDYGIDPLLARWRAAAVPEGTALTVHEPGGAVLAGVYAGLSDEGAMRLRLADGQTRVIHAGDVMLAP
ncbi:biotin--[acetyl-CoA-carboxylase] ligase [Alteriqipengyuania lutimaris]|uniref:biotin--[biotin carboxyl-carrier protein] ligase n=1 Tax=Alteriqipengyuania lutimaris TaxID=1538146 RepID=A0A395LMD0_9SPHN|nr:biotin--[acetyl-CoA-carboxylase] ligase [Alteriqipengyuania lutimaris]MBB3032801.1 BirA family biotin operon repressor/biotin-[acetyl-CoA-carboxylase] ligase [Alteriqipengyuania lutimaris]RDS78102.1 biotin--[acetyl-CoA-carboxylase] ligase [Alteriqipengyuania lutimaris]